MNRGVRKNDNAWKRKLRWQAAQAQLPIVSRLTMLSTMSLRQRRSRRSLEVTAENRAPQPLSRRTMRTKLHSCGIEHDAYSKIFCFDCMHWCTKQGMKSIRRTLPLQLGQNSLVPKYRETATIDFSDALTLHSHERNFSDWLLEFGGNSVCPTRLIATLGHRTGALWQVQCLFDRCAEAQD